MYIPPKFRGMENLIVPRVTTGINPQISIIKQPFIPNTPRAITIDIVMVMMDTIVVIVVVVVVVVVVAHVVVVVVVIVVVAFLFRRFLRLVACHKCERVS